VSFATISDLRQGLGSKASKHSPEYTKKMMHDLPEGEIVDRSKFILEKVRGQRVLEFGASGPMHDAIVKTASFVLGVDREDGPGIRGFDLDEVRVDASLACKTNGVGPALYFFIKDEGAFTPDIIVCGEILEHLANPGFFLQRLRAQYPTTLVLITVPNAYCDAGRSHLKNGIENVNIDHVSWYSPRTLKTLVERYGYTIQEFAYYNGNGPTAEGLIAVLT
jgi:hypothetical protein